MLFTKKHLLLSVFLAASTVQGHMMMSSPVPFGKDTLNNSPLAGDGSDFPCKLRSDTYSYTADVLTANTYHVGDSPLLSFIGGATHGGGSCQVSLTTDLEPTANSKWFVINSIEGGCPTNAPGNIGDDAAAPDPTTFNFTVPDIAEGRYTLAWTWFNRIGNREMYMNCAPVQILSKAGSKKREEETSLSKRADFPEMFVANINGCTTTEDFDIRFPNPGDSVQYLGEASNLQPSGQAACTGGAGPTATGVIPAPTPTGTDSPSGASGGSSVASAGGSTTGAPSTLTTTTATATAPENTVQPVPAPTSTPSSTTTIPPTDPAATSTPSTSGSGGTTSGALSGPCSTEGTWNCIDGTSFQRCASGAWSAAQPVAAGTKCAAGQSSDLSLVADKRDYAGQIHNRRYLIIGKA